MTARNKTLSWLSPVLALAFGLSAAGCYAEARTQPAYVEAAYVPPHIEAYPSYYYEGRTVYLVNDHWYYRSGPRWVYYRTEPEVLYRRRAVIRQAPPAPERRHYVPAHEHREDRREGHHYDHDDRHRAPPARDD